VANIFWVVIGRLSLWAICTKERERETGIKQGLCGGHIIGS